MRAYIVKLSEEGFAELAEALPAVSRTVALNSGLPRPHYWMYDAEGNVLVLTCAPVKHRIIEWDIPPGIHRITRAEATRLAAATGERLLTGRPATKLIVDVQAEPEVDTEPDVAPSA